MERRRGFSLVELVVIILILGILASITAAKLLGGSETAKEARLKHTLSIVRDSIQLYASRHGGKYPGADGKEATFKADLAHYVIYWPENPLGAVPTKRGRIIIRVSGVPLAYQITNQEGWIFDKTTGEFRANTNALSSDGVTKYSEY